LLLLEISHCLAAPVASLRDGAFEIGRKTHNTIQLICEGRGCEPLSGQRRNVPYGLWFAPLGVLRPSVQLLCAFAPRTGPVAQVLCLTPRAAVRVSGAISVALERRRDAFGLRL
jgi:hypothetical protein